MFAYFQNSRHFCPGAISWPAFDMRILPISWMRLGSVQSSLSFDLPFCHTFDRFIHQILHKILFKK
jgi:hypothetical protein